MSEATTEKATTATIAACPRSETAALLLPKVSAEPMTESDPL